MLKSKGFKYRKLSKNLPTGVFTQRDEQFKIIFHLVTIMSLDSPVISIDCKKKELLGNLYREGKPIRLAKWKCLTMIITILEKVKLYRMESLTFSTMKAI